MCSAIPIIYRNFWVSNLENSEIALWINLSFVFVPGAISVLQVKSLVCYIHH
jgi:hypothetical protein